MMRMRGIVTGMLLGATAVTLYGMMNARSQRRLGKAAVTAGKRMADAANDWFGR